MQRNYRQITPTHTTRPYKMGKANSQEKGRLLVIPYLLIAGTGRRFACGCLGNGGAK
jgi:hypothetical protein